MTINKFKIILLSFLFLSIGIREAYSQDKTTENIGDIFLFTLPIVTLATTIIKKDKEGTKQFLKGFLINTAATYALKYGINKRRPNNNGDYAFPSGHTSISFQSAAFMDRRYGLKYGAPAYLLAGFVGYSRINAKRHDGWDVLGGMILGIGSSYLFTTPYQKEHMQLTFDRQDGKYLVGFIYKF